LTPDLHHKPQLALTKHRLNGPHGPGQATDDDPVADLKQLLARQVAGRDDLLTATQFVPVLEGRHRAANDMRARSRGETSFLR